mmetsp:Transcript_7938/g.16089  ORF Transcript_7938/g.16089 Transcript_7938/m.16089 type:complete len:119 (-) Transcript_7938:92-448(-)
MESSGLPGKVHCTKAIVDLVESDFEFESRGEVEIKSVGKMETFILTQRKRSFTGQVQTSRRQRRRSSLLTNSLQTLKSSRQLLEEKITDLQDCLDDKEQQKNGRRPSDSSDASFGDNY